jgi:hypothetical protein
MWNRTFSQECFGTLYDKYHASNQLRQVLERTGCKRLVIGHTPQVLSWCCVGLASLSTCRLVLKTWAGEARTTRKFVPSGSSSRAGKTSCLMHCGAQVASGLMMQQQGLNSECDGMVWRVDVGMSSGVLNAMPQVCSPPSHTPYSTGYARSLGCLSKSFHASGIHIG